MANANHPANEAARVIAKIAPTLFDAGHVFQEERDALMRALPLLKWLGTNADVLRDTGRRIAMATREIRLLTDAEIEALAADPAVAVVLATFPDARCAETSKMPHEFPTDDDTP